MAETSDVVIVGGGVAGCAVAYYLALAGVKSTIIEREGLGTQASGYSAGGLNPLQGLGVPGPLSGLSIESYRMHLNLWDGLKEQTGIDYEGHIVTLLQVAFDENEASDLEGTIEVFSDADGFDAHRLDPGEVSALEPRINPGVVAGVYARGKRFPGQLQVQPLLLDKRRSRWAPASGWVRCACWNGGTDASPGLY